MPRIPAFKIGKPHYEYLLSSAEVTAFTEPLIQF